MNDHLTLREAAIEAILIREQDTAFSTVARIIASLPQPGGPFDRLADEIDRMYGEAHRASAEGRAWLASEVLLTLTGLVRELRAKADAPNCSTAES